MYTEYGEYMRIMRIKHHEIMLDTAKLLNVSLPFVSAVESGKRSIPEEWLEVLSAHYNLTPQQKSELKKAMDHSKTHAKIDLTKQSPIKREVALEFQRSFEELDETTAASILDLLRSRKEN